MAPNASTANGKRNEKSKLRKPVVEKMRRDRINKSIEQLKQLLKDGLGSMQPTSKLEKADILEMAVSYLKSTATSRPPPAQSFSDGFARCLKETIHFLSIHGPLKAEDSSVFRQINQTLHPKVTAKSTGVSVEKSVRDVQLCKDVHSIWRPW